MNEALEPIARSRSLTLIETGQSKSGQTIDSGAKLQAFRADSCFLAHLLAVRHDTPAMRLKRRASPTEAVQAYGSASHQLVQGIKNNVRIAA